MTFDEAINIKYANIDMTTGEKIPHRDKYTRAINLLGGLDAVIPFIPFSLEIIQNALKSDEHLNNLTLCKWSYASGFNTPFINRGICEFIGGGIWHLYSKAKITSASCSEGVCLLKEAARQWAERGY